MAKENCNDKTEETKLDNEFQKINSNIKDFPLPEVNFSTFIFSLNSSALVQLGLLKDPISGNKTTNLILAKHTIDTIAMLENKTVGNLSSEEYKMISDILYDLKIMYVKQCE